MAVYKAKLDNAAKAISIIILVGVLLPVITITQLAFAHGAWYMLLVPLLLLGVLIVSLMLRPMGYKTEQGQLIIERLWKPVHVPLSSITAVQAVTKKELGFGMRTFGVGGFLGYFGHFRYSIGPVTMYVTDMDRRILLTLDTGKMLLISPSETDAFMAEITGKKRRGTGISQNMEE